MGWRAPLSPPQGRAVAHMARGQERQSIIDALPRRESGKSKDWNEGFDAAIAGVIAVLVGRSFTH